MTDRNRFPFVASRGLPSGRTVASWFTTGRAEGGRLPMERRNALASSGILWALREEDGHDVLDIVIGYTMPPYPTEEQHGLLSTIGSFVFEDGFVSQATNALLAALAAGQNLRDSDILEGVLATCPEVVRRDKLCAQYLGHRP